MSRKQPAALLPHTGVVYDFLDQVPAEPRRQHTKPDVVDQPVTRNLLIFLPLRHRHDRER